MGEDPSSYAGSPCFGVEARALGCSSEGADADPLATERHAFTRVCVNTGAWYTHRTGRIVDTFRSFFLAPQAIGAVGKWESCFWISTFPPHPVLQPGLFG